MNILAIETSCDDTCIAIIKTSGRKKPCFKILSNIVSSQIEVHKKYGGVYPTLARREHKKNLPLVLEKALKKIKRPKIDLIAVTAGPGLDPCLWTGINFAKDLSKKWDLPIVPVNHIESHILVNFIDRLPTFPAICLVVSGGHTQLILMQGIGKYKILGETRDDAAGECFDKVARILGLGYPGGPAIASQCKSQIPSTKSQTNPKSQAPNIKLPRPMINQKNYDFSFSGLKTAVLYKYKNKKYIKEMCKEVQQAIIDILIKKTIKAAKDYRVKTIILGGGVSANKELRKQFKSKWEYNLLVPSKEFSTDNAVMTGIAGYFGKPKNWQKIKADANLRIC
ncbi:tRNA (adenosine(37)-N6)-threonylcarbamoyltransferase complex transferase subunit TsaD, partial [Patescibacteria group bacterium]|nr:tRNA (adenosine(37)-N6)-threonylcarbamoyltransferase complex transferase subunit TsaD [Patescibacteria group bacterium]